MATTVSEQLEGTHEAFEAGPTIFHAHMSNDDETSISEPEKSACLKEGPERHCPEMIVQFPSRAHLGVVGHGLRYAFAAPRHGFLVIGAGWFSYPRLREPSGSGGMACGGGKIWRAVGNRGI